MNGTDFQFDSMEAICSDLKIVFITDEKMAATGSTGVHMHSFWEVFCLFEGKLTVTSEKESFELEEGDFLIVPPSVYHSSHSSENAVKRSVFFTFEKVKSREEDDEPLFSKVQAAFVDRFHFLKGDGYTATLLAHILEGYQSDAIAQKHRIRANIAELVFHFYDRMKDESHTYRGESSLQGSYWVYKYAIDRLLDIYYMTDISLQELADKIYTSPKSIARIISSAYGKSFNELKLELKMRNAKKMLRESDMPVSKIAEQVGYTTCRGFLSAFAKYEGTTPSEYRKKVCTGDQ